MEEGPPAEQERLYGKPVREGHVIENVTRGELEKLLLTRLQRHFPEVHSVSIYLHQNSSGWSVSSMNGAHDYNLVLLELPSIIRELSRRFELIL